MIDEIGLDAVDECKRAAACEVLMAFWEWKDYKSKWCFSETASRQNGKSEAEKYTGKTLQKAHDDYDDYDINL
jgi:hypothetical protein